MIELALDNRGLRPGRALSADDGNLGKQPTGNHNAAGRQQKSKSYRVGDEPRGEQQSTRNGKQYAFGHLLSGYFATLQATQSAGECRQTLASQERDPNDGGQHHQRNGGQGADGATDLYEQVHFENGRQKKNQ